MAAKKLLSLLLLLLPAFLHAQITGRVEDTIARQPLRLAVASLISVKDSVLVSFARTNAQGQFTLPVAPAGRYVLRLTYPNYAEYADVIEVPASGTLALSRLPLLTKEKVLEEVIVKQRIAAMRLKGDTIEYVADSFKVEPNASVADLLKRLPGIQVNGKGEIVAQGQKVEKILVDGEEFFSDDPAVVSKNLRADAVDKLQVFDKKSDQAAFTGIDDGQTSKTINLSLKDNAKKGYFGKAEAGTDFNNYYRGKLLANAFRAKQKIAGYLTTDNTQFQSLNWEERDKYSTDADRSVQVGDDGSIWMYSNGDEWSRGQGLPKALSGGLMFSNKWGTADKNNLNLNYQLNDQRVQGNRSSTTQTILPDTSFVNNTRSTFNSERQRHRLFGTYEYTIDSTSSLKIVGKGTMQKSNALQRYIGESVSEDGRIINTSDRTTTGTDDSRQYDLNAFYRKKFAKAGRTMSINLDGKHNTATYDGFLLATNRFFDKTGQPVLLNNIDQNKNSSSYQTVVTTKAIYTEPLAKKLFLELSAAYASSRNDAERNTFEKAPGSEQYLNRIDSLSNHFIFNTYSYSGGSSLRYTGKKITTSIGAQLGETVFNQRDVRRLNERQARFTNFLPKAGFEYKPKKQTRFGINYNGSNTNPTLNQIQPVIDNSDPLNQTIGNPNLRQSFTHNLNLNVSDYKVIKRRNLWASIWGNMVQNAITGSNFVDSLGRRINQYVNVNGNYNVGGYIGYGREVGKSVNININYEPSINRYSNFVNGVRNTTNNQRHEIGLNSGYWGDHWINYWVNLSAGHNRSLSSINPDQVTRYWDYNFSPNVTLKYKKKWIMEIEGDIRLYQRTAVFANQQDFYIVNTTLKRLLGKKNQWEIGLVVNDIFNQNVGFRRDISTNFISESRWQQVQRYGLLTLAYNFTRNNAQNTAK